MRPSVCTSISITLPRSGEARRTDEPDPLAARAREAGGADGITVHLREDRRHIQDADVDRLADLSPRAQSRARPERRDRRARLPLRPHQATLVPERREEVTTEGGLRAARRRSAPRGHRRLDEAGCRVSLFIDPDPGPIDAAKDLGVPAVELHTGRYAHPWRQGRRGPRRAAPRPPTTPPIWASPCTPATA